MYESENTVAQNDLNVSENERADDAEQTNFEETANETHEVAEKTASTNHEVTDDTNEAAEKTAIVNHEVADKKKIRLPKFLQKINAYLKAHENIRQMVYFFMFSILCGLSQMIVTYGLSAGLKLEPHLGSTRLDWFVFRCNTQADFIGFLVGSVVGQVLTFVLNRKKTFNARDYIALRAIMYTILAVLIIIMQTALGNAVNDACKQAKPDATGFLEFLFNLTGQAVAGISALVVNFLGNKFLVMRNWGKKKAKADGAEQANAEDIADVDHEVANADFENVSIEAACDVDGAEVSE